LFLASSSADAISSSGAARPARKLANSESSSACASPPGRVPAVAISAAQSLAGNSKR
jgi:hypothetical protein